ncbi:MAG: glycosyltransferase family protein [Pseudomonadota bacterium]
MLAILQARCSSTRLPGKVLKPILGEPMIARHIERLRRARGITQLVVATSNTASDDALSALCTRLQVPCFRGPLDDVLARFYAAACAQEARAHLLRLTGDCPLADPELIDRCIAFHLAGDYDYSSNALQPSFADGLDVEVMRFRCLEEAWREASLPAEREHVTPFIYKQAERYRIGHYRQAQDQSWLRWTVDQPEDFAFVEAVYQALYPHNAAFTTADILALLARQPELLQLNTHVPRNLGYAQSLLNEALGAQLPVQTIAAS